MEAIRKNGFLISGTDPFVEEALHVKAKGDPDCRLYSLYDKLYREDVLLHAWRCCRANGGSAGVDGITFEQIETGDVSRWLEELAREVREKTYRPQAVRRVWIPKPGGKQRPLGIPCIKDRVVQMAAVLVLEPIFEADLPEEQYGYRRGRSAHDAIRRIHGWLNQGYREVVDCDLSGYFDTIPHSPLMRSVARRISDGAMLALIKMWLGMPVEEDDGHGGRKRTTVAKDSFDFLGYTLGRCYSPKTGRAYLGTRPSDKRIRAICEEISQMTRRQTYWKPVEKMVEELNRTLRGWGNYFSLGPVSRAYRVVDNHTRHRLRQWLNGKHKSRGVSEVRHAAAQLHRDLGLLRLENTTSNRPWAYT